MFRPTRLMVAAAAVALTALAGPAQASDPVAKELVGYVGAEVLLDRNHAKDCNLENSGPALLARLEQALGKIGLTKRSDAVTGVVLQVANRGFGMLSAQCAIFTQLSFSTHIPKEMLTNLSAQQQAALARMGSLPVILWSATSMSVAAQTEPSGGGKSMKAEEAALKMVESMVDLLASQRQ